MIHQNVQKLINDYQAILDRDPLDQMEDTQSILTRFAQLVAAEIGEIVVASPYMEGTRMYFDEKIARYAAAGEYDDGAKVWMLMSLPKEMEIQGDPHAAFLLAKTSHDGSSSVVVRPIIERLFCARVPTLVILERFPVVITVPEASGSVSVLFADKVVGVNIARQDPVPPFRPIILIPSCVDAETQV